MWSIKEKHDVSQILAHLVPEEGADFSPRPESAANIDSVSEKSMEVSISNAQASTSSVEGPSTVPVLPSFTEIEEVPKVPILSQINAACEPLGETLIATYFHEIGGLNTPPSLDTLLAQTSHPNKNGWSPKIKMWLGKWGPSRTQR